MTKQTAVGTPIVLIPRDAIALPHDVHLLKKYPRPAKISRSTLGSGPAMSQRLTTVNKNCRSNTSRMADQSDCRSLIQLSSGSCGTLAPADAGEAVIKRTVIRPLKPSTPSAGAAEAALEVSSSSERNRVASVRSARSMFGRQRSPVD